MRKAWWVSHEPSGLLAASDPHGSSHVYAGGFATILETTGGSQTWDNRPINGGTQAMEPGALAVDWCTATQTLYAGFSGVWAHGTTPQAPSQPQPQS